MSRQDAQSLVEQAEGRKIYDEAIREIALGHVTFEHEVHRLKIMQRQCQAKGDVKTCRHWTIAERMLVRQRKVLTLD